MATALNDEKIIGGLGMAAVIVFLAAMAIAIILDDTFIFGSGSLGDLFTEAVFAGGCVVAGALGAVFGLLITYKKAESKVFIGKIRGILMILAGVALVVLGVTEGEQWAIYLFIALAILAAASDMFCDWVTDQKVLMVFSLILTLIMALTGILSQTGDNNIMGFAFAIVVMAWVALLAAVRFAPVVEAAPEKTKKKSKGGKAPGEAKKNVPAPKPYPAKKEPAPAPKKPATEKPAYKEVPRKEEPKKEPPKAEPPKPAEAQKEQPKLKVMSSREAAAARDAHKKEEPPEPVPEPVKAESVPEAVPEPIPEPVPEPVPEPIPEPVPEPIPEPVPEPVPGADGTEAEDAPEDYYDDFEIVEDTPSALLRRATWNKGLRCRRDYGENQIPIAYVKAKVAVYVEAEAGDTSIDERLRAEGWTVFRYLESDITDGKEQAEEINRAVKENLKADRSAKKKRAVKK
ncbi:MAG: hypothetical protein FWH47_05585 [Methanomassiliicoccaceae archaeon]|nr:hypothetical protein [Methanomassiliicoccaceae archaeon]